MRNLLYKISKAYYEEDLTQEQIARRFGISRIKISRLLRQAHEEKIVQINIVPPDSRNAELEGSLERGYGLDEAIIVTPIDYERNALTHALGQAVVDCLNRSLQGIDILALTWGSTLLAVIDAMPASHLPKIRVVQMLGGLGSPEADIHGADLARRMAQALDARPRLLPAPGIVASKLVRDALLAEPQICDILALAARADIALVGIGVPTAESVVRQAGTILTDLELEQLRAAGAVGDIALRFFDAAGRPIGHEVNDRVIGLDLDAIRRLPRVIAVAGGASKYAAIRGALRGKLIDVLVTDERTARRLVEGDLQQPIEH